MKRYREKERGITLVALVITVIIIIILATVTINMAFGDNGLITQAQRAKDMTANSIVAEQEGMNSVLSEYLNVMGEDSEITPPELEVPDIPGGEEAVEQGAIAFTNLTWSSGQASVTVSTNTSYTMQYQVVANEGASSEENWQAVPEGGIIGNLNHRDVVYARLVQGTNYGEEASTTVKDENEPQVATIDLSSTNVTTGTNLTATVTHIDNESGPNISQCKYIWSTSNAKLGTDPSLYTEGTFSSNGQQISKTMSTAGTWYLHVLTVDNAGNGTETVSAGITVRQLVTSISVSPSSVTIEEGQTSQLSVTVNPSNANNKTVAWSSSNDTIASVNSSGLVTAKKAGSVTITATAADGSGAKGTCKVTVESAGIPESTSYVGYYADVDGNGSVDGIIYADLAIGGSGTWGDSNGKYTIPKGSNFKKYSICKTNHTDDFGTEDVIKVANTSGNPRFYVMALDDVDSNYHYWYYSALSYGMSDWSSTTSTVFGSGEQNTRNMITKWNGSKYGSQNGNTRYPDVWGLSTVQSKINANPAWYVPSKEEWSAFAGELEITSGDYGDKSLRYRYWSSSQYNTNLTYYTTFSDACMGSTNVNYNGYVRLGTTF